MAILARYARVALDMPGPAIQGRAQSWAGLDTLDSCQGRRSWDRRPAIDESRAGKAIWAASDTRAPGAVLRAGLIPQLSLLTVADERPLEARDGQIFRAGII